MRKLFILLAISILAMSITGCSGPAQLSSEDTPSSLGLVLGIHENFRAIPTETLSNYIYDCAYSYGTCSTVIAEGKPSISSNHIIEKPSANINNAKRVQLADQNSTYILNEIASLKATTPEVDTLKAISVASESLNSLSSNCKKTMIIIDSGLSTTGLINFASTNVIDNSPDYIVNQLMEMHALPSLQGINIKWIGLGQTAGVQTELSSSYKYKLQELWNSILTASGASVEFLGTPLPNVEPSCELPSVTVVPVVEDCLTLEASNIPDAVKFDEDSSVKFKGDQAVFIDQRAAKEELKPIAEYLISTKKKMYIVGMTATHGDAAQRQQLSLERSEACKKVLVDYGVSPSQLITVGLGFQDNILRVDDTDANGNLIESQAKTNRAVYFIKEDSSLVDIIISPTI